MGPVDRIRRLHSKLATARKTRRERPKRGRSQGGEGSLPGGAGSKEAAETNPQRAAELAD